MDAFFAILLFVMVTLGVYTYFISFYSLQQQWYMSEDIMRALSTTKIKELDLESELYPQINDLYTKGILNEELTIIEQIDILRKKEDIINAQKILDDIISPIRGERFGIKITVEDLIGQESKLPIYEKGDPSQRLGSTTSQRYLLRKK